MESNASSAISHQNFSITICDERHTYTTLNISPLLATISDHDHHCHPFHTWEAAVVLSLMLLGLFLNGFILLTFLQVPRIRNLTNYFVASLAVTGILMLVTSPTLLLLTILHKIDKTFGEHIRTCSEVFCATASMMNFGCIGIDRMIAITRPLYHHALPPSRALRPIAIIWTLAAMATFAYALFVDKHPETSQIVLFCLVFVIPMFCTILSYAVITRVVLFSPRHYLERSHQRHRNMRESIRFSWKILLVILPGIIVWSIFWVPISMQAADQNLQFSHTFEEVRAMMPISIAVVNPLIYTLMTTEFRRKLVNLLNCRQNRTIPSTLNRTTSRLPHSPARNMNNTTSPSVISTL